MRFGTVAVAVSGLITLANAATQTVFIDDVSSEIKYLGDWNVGHECPGCYAQPDPKKAHGGTWHDGTYTADRKELGFSFSFTGVSFEIILIYIDDPKATYTTNTDFSVAVDTSYAVGVRRTKEDHGGFTYDNVAYRLTGLSNVTHNVVVKLNSPSVMLLDCVSYEYEEPEVITTSSSSSTSSTTSTSTSTSTTSSTSSSSSESSSESSTARPKSSTSSSTSSSNSSTESSSRDAGVSNLNNNNSNKANEGEENGNKDNNSALIGPIIGGALAGLALIAGIIFFCWYRKRFLPAKRAMMEAQPRVDLHGGVFPPMQPHLMSQNVMGHQGGYPGPMPYSAVPLRSQGPPSDWQSFANTHSHGGSTAPSESVTPYGGFTSAPPSATGWGPSGTSSQVSSSPAMSAVPLMAVGAVSTQPNTRRSSTYKSPLPFAATPQQSPRVTEHPSLSYAPPVSYQPHPMMQHQGDYSHIPIPPIPQEEDNEYRPQLQRSLSAATAPPPYSPGRDSPPPQNILQQ